jgi:hypothetical protein
MYPIGLCSGAPNPKPAHSIPSTIRCRPSNLEILDPWFDESEHFGSDKLKVACCPPPALRKGGMQRSQNGISSGIIRARKLLLLCSVLNGPRRTQP